MNLIFPFQRFILFFTLFSSTLHVINIEVFMGEFFACKNLNQRGNFTYVAVDICMPTANIWHIYKLRF